MSSDHIHTALCTAAVMSGVRDHLQDERIAFDTFLEKWGQGCIELYYAVAELGIKCSEVYIANLPKNFLGVFDYEVSEPLGYWIAKQIMENGDFDRKEANQKLIDLTNAFFKRGKE